MLLIQRPQDMRAGEVPKAKIASIKKYTSGLVLKAVFYNYFSKQDNKDNAQMTAFIHLIQ